MSTGKKVSIVIVNYNSSDRCNELLSSLKKINKIIGEVIIIDNNSNKLNKKILRENNHFRLINNKNNFGFSKAANLGIAKSNYQYILLLNPDCKIIDSSPIKTFNKIINNKDIGIIGGQIINSRGLRQYTATSKPNFLTGLFEFTNLKKIFPNNYFSKKFWIESYKKISQPTKVFSLCGAYIFIRKSDILFNEKYFLYLEDLDLGNVAEKHGFEVWLDPESQVLHIGGQSNNSKYHSVLKEWYISRKIYFKENLSYIQGSLLYIIFQVEEKILTIFHTIKGTPNE